MKHPKFYAGCMLTLLVASGAHALTTPEAGQNERIEWKILQNWPTTGQTLDMVHSLDGKFVYILNDNKQVQVFSAQGQLQGAIPVAEGVSSIDIAPQGETLYLINNKDNSFSSVSVSFVVDIDTVGSPFEGPADAPVTVAIFSDFE